MLITSSWLIDLVIFTFLSLTLLYKYLSRNNDYWASRGVHFIKPKAFIGNAADIFFMRTSMGLWLKSVYESSDAPYSGFFIMDEPHLLLRSPELIKHVLIKDFHSFSDRTIASPEHNPLIQNLLFIQKNPRWKDTRAKLTQVFSTGKLKGMFPIITTVANEFALRLKEKAGVLDAKGVLLKYSTEITARCFFGIQAHSFDNDDAVFNVISRKMFSPSLRNGFAQMAYFCGHNLVRLFHIEFIAPWIQNYLKETFWNVMKQRETTGVRINDFIDILGDLMKSDAYFQQDRDMIVGQVVQFYIGGYETTSTTVSFAIYELAMNQHVQTIAREEILRNLKKHKTFDYEGVKELTYLDGVIYETLRKYPALPFLDRRCNNDYKLPNSDLVIEKGVPVYIPSYALHMSDKYFPEPQKFIPERFVQKNDHNKEGLVYMPFGSGPRVCIGERFGFLSSKIALATILANFEITPCSITPTQLVYDPLSVLMNAKGGLPVKFTPLASN